MTVKEFIKKLQKIKPELQDKHIQIQMPNGLIANPEIKIILKDKIDASNKSANNVNYILIC